MNSWGWRPCLAVCIALTGFAWTPECALATAGLRGCQDQQGADDAADSPESSAVSGGTDEPDGVLAGDAGITPEFFSYEFSSHEFSSHESSSLSFLGLEFDEGRASLDFHLAVDGVKYGSRNRRSSGVEFDTADLVFELQLPRTRLYLRPDWIGVDTPSHFREAWIERSLGDHFDLRLGLQRLPLGLEAERNGEDLLSLGRAFPNSLSGRTDWALTAHHYPDGEWLDALVGVGFGHGFGLEGKRERGMRWFARATVTPLPRGGGWQRGLSGGIGYAFDPRSDHSLFVTTPTESAVFRTGDLRADRGRWLHLFGRYEAHGLVLEAERVLGALEDVPLATGGRIDFDQLTAWQATLFWQPGVSLTAWRSRGSGEASGTPSATRDESWVESGVVERETPWWERVFLAARYSNADIDRALFDHGFATYDPSTQEVRTFTGTLGILPRAHLRVGFHVVRTIADHELTTFGGSNRDMVYVLRVEWLP